MARPKSNTSAESPFPTRFARSTRPSGRSPHPGELLPYPSPVGNALMDLSEYFPSADISAIQSHKSISFHAFGDSGVGTSDQAEVVDAMSRDVDTSHPERSPAFLLHLGDIIYGPDKTAGYAGKFYRPNHSYPNLIFAIPGNHDGEMRSDQDRATLEAYFENFCAPKGTQPPLAKSFGRAMPHQPGAYWRLACPFVDIVGLYSCTGENFGTIAHREIGDKQKVWLGETLKEIASERKAGKRRALVLAVHHPPFASGLSDTTFGHPGNPQMLADFDECSTAAGVWPDLVLSAHAHNYQRYMRTVKIDGKERVIPYIVAGGGGIGPQKAPAPIGTFKDGTTYANGVSGRGYLKVDVGSEKLTYTYTLTVDTHRDVFETHSLDLKTGRPIG